MRTTLTIDDDVAALLKRLRKTRDMSFKVLINEALRRGLQQMTAPPRQGKVYNTRSVSLGRCLVGTVDDISEALAVAEGDDYK
ncbi:MAG: ribbon-helix-helix protein, CopG family [Deltaproteobacteria bacterium]|nr:ribbon-helix-helix protein, CopG family [Deltaproteobacteria bacterium]MBW2072159.1 ribbon-helix-helix protein, CopG family [Deltaproteobacteria bacterium]